MSSSLLSELQVTSFSLTASCHLLKSTCLFYPGMFSCESMTVVVSESNVYSVEGDLIQVRNFQVQTETIICLLNAWMCRQTVSCQSTVCLSFCLCMFVCLCVCPSIVTCHINCFWWYTTSSLFTLVVTIYGGGHVTCQMSDESDSRLKPELSECLICMYSCDCRVLLA